MQNISLYSLHYDYQWNETYRDFFVLSDSIGKKVTVVWRDEEGKETEEEWYVDYGVNVVAGYKYIYVDEEEPAVISSPDLITYRDDENQLEYIKINNFKNSKGTELLEYLENVTYDKIVIDMRENYGGRQDYARRYIYPALYGTDITHSVKWRVPDTEANQPIIGGILVKLSNFGNKKEGFYYYEEVNTFRGTQNKEREIYYLIGPATGSAADGFAAFIKEHDLGTLVGAATGGEGQGSSFVMQTMENSSLVYTFYPTEYVDTEQTNPCAGVEPDVYLNQTLEDYKLELECIWDGTEEEYENRLKYDTLLKWVIHQAESEN